MKTVHTGLTGHGFPRPDWTWFSTLAIIFVPLFKTNFESPPAIKVFDHLVYSLLLFLLFRFVMQWTPEEDPVVICLSHKPKRIGTKRKSGWCSNTYLLSVYHIIAFLLFLCVQCFSSVFPFHKNLLLLRNIFYSEKIRFSKYFSNFCLLGIANVRKKIPYFCATRWKHTMITPFLGLIL